MTTIILVEEPGFEFIGLPGSEEFGKHNIVQRDLLVRVQRPCKCIALDGLDRLAIDSRWKSFPLNPGSGAAGIKKAQ